MIESEKDGSSFTAYRSPPNSKADWHRWCKEDFLCARTLNAAFLLKLPMTDILTPPNGQFNIPKCKTPWFFHTDFLIWRQRIPADVHMLPFQWLIVLLHQFCTLKWAIFCEQIFCEETCSGLISSPHGSRLIFIYDLKYQCGLVSASAHNIQSTLTVAIFSLVFNC